MKPQYGVHEGNIFHRATIRLTSCMAALRGLSFWAEYYSHPEQVGTLKYKRDIQTVEHHFEVGIAEVNGFPAS